MSSPLLLVKYGKVGDALEVRAGRTAHAVVAERFGIPEERLRLVYRGQQFANDATATQALLDLSAAGRSVLVVGTPRTEQLDAPAPSSQRLWTFVVTFWLWFVALVSRIAAQTGHVVYLFIASLLPTLPPDAQQRRRRQQRADDDQHRLHAD
mmetsp:Transcript_8017/g.24770  ORF Transcript_8017/g.24770 Transcript_8017/m.24770 type:complete len:152 (+) Transcript_8017:86-541(+)